MKTPWALAAFGLLVALIPAAATAFRGDRGDRLVGLEMCSVLLVLFTVVLAEATGRPALLDLAVTAAVLSFGGALVFAYFLERWL
jgi:multisubunit Na+/H+ antiporter MnhF subunit